MKHLLRRSISFVRSNYVKRFFQTSNLKQSYEGDGKTSITFLSKDAYYGLMVSAVRPWGFVFSNKKFVLGSTIIFPKSLIAWTVSSSAEINADSLSLFSVLEPKLDLLVIGLDGQYNPRSKTVENIRSILTKENISHEILPVEQAVAVFNFLNSDQRYVAAALIPPKPKEIVTRPLPTKSGNESSDK